MAYHPHGGGGGGGSGPSSSSSFAMPFSQGRSRNSPQPSSSTTRGHGGMPDFGHFQPSPMLGLQDGQFDIFEWYPQFQSCLRYFLDHAQFSGPVQAVAAFVNIQLPYQRSHHLALSSRSGSSPSAIPSPSPRAGGTIPLSSSSGSLATLTPYIRRLVATGFDFPGVLHGFFGDDWVAGVGQMHEVERRNYLFAAKSACWLDVKRHYDEGEGQTVPFLRPLQHSTEEEIANADSHWSEWLAMQDWLIGPRSLDNLEGSGTSNSPPRFKREPPDDRHGRYHVVD
ncbi:hypothetical protein PFICI_07649 [Pestalotiopsis fici W106-1]|uniref:Ilp is an apoptosis inhibitor n=1 Tax=Pestalotiopsis fici (strain W106-1 / CGMCC3.15140) TaxID=1229662 RepID=W3X215_PESFW|nr:uncharacterized protein PFICI_07649 [Pestalotiopsis fici W106-1]ETS80120.1 hypothetical protein PFICI_07649 [Pestalotiopsis fici W106-1]